LRDPISKKPITKKGWWSGSRCRPWRGWGQGRIRYCLSKILRWPGNEKLSAGQICGTGCWIYRKQPKVGGSTSGGDGFGILLRLNSKETLSLPQVVPLLNLLRKSLYFSEIKSE
jgi:hypothetical protein